MKTIEELRIKLADLQKVRNVTDRDIEAVEKKSKYSRTRNRIA